MKRKEVSGMAARMSAYNTTMKKEGDNTLAKHRCNFSVADLGLAFGPEKSIDKDGNTSRRVLILGIPPEMNDRVTYGKDGPKVQVVEVDGKPCAQFGARVTKTKPHLTSQEVKFITGTTTVVRVNKGAWFDSVPSGTPMTLFDVNASMGESKKAGIGKYINAAGAEPIDTYKGEKANLFYPFDQLVRAFAKARMFTRSIPSFNEALGDGNLFPDPGMAFIVPIGEETEQLIESETGAPSPIKAYVMGESEKTKFSYKRQGETFEKAFISTSVWCEPREGEDVKGVVLKWAGWEDEMQKYGFCAENAYQSEVLSSTVLPFVIHANRIMIFSPNLKRSNELSENSMVTDGTITSLAGAFDGNMITLFDYPGTIRKFGLKVTADWAKDFATSEEIQREAEISDPKIAAKTENAAKMTLKSSGVIPLNVPSKMQERVLKKIADGEASDIEFFVFIPQLMMIHKENGVRALAERAGEMSAQDSTSLVNFLMNGSSDENDLTTDAKKIVDDKLCVGISGSNTPSFEKVAVFAIEKPGNVAPVYEMFVENVFRVQNADASAKEAPKTAE